MIINNKLKKEPNIWTELLPPHLSKLETKKSNRTTKTLLGIAVTIAVWGIVTWLV